MHVQKTWFVWALAIGLGGCGYTFLPEGQDGSRPTLNLSTGGLNDGSAYVEGAANDFFPEAESIELAGQARTILGSISGPEDVDVYDLGPVEPGDRVVVAMTTVATLDGAIALFDEQGTAWLVDDHRNVYLGRAEPFVDVVVRESSAHCYLAVSATPGYDAFGDYALDALKESGTVMPAVRPDTVLLVFDGGSNVRIGGRPAAEVPAFDAADIDAEYRGESEALMAQIVARVRQDYDGFEVNILSTSEGAVFDPGMTRVFFGTFDQALLGIAQGVDEFNSIQGQSAIVFTDTFEAFMTLSPSVAEMGQAIANVASHEIGHLLGLVHTDDPQGIMDVTAGLKELLEDQTFRRSPIYTDVFPLGFQDEVRSLLDSVGGDMALRMTEKVGSDREPVRGKARGDQKPAREHVLFSSCDLCNHSGS